MRLPSRSWQAEKHKKDVERAGVKMSDKLRMKGGPGSARWMEPPHGGLCLIWRGAVDVCTQVHAFGICWDGNSVSRGREPGRCPEEKGGFEEGNETVE